MNRTERYAAAGRILLISGFLALALWLDGALLVTMATPDSTLETLLVQVVYWGLWFGPVTFVLLIAGCGCFLRSTRHGLSVP